MDKTNSNGTDLRCEPLPLLLQDLSPPVLAPETPKKNTSIFPKSSNREKGQEQRVETFRRKAKEKEDTAQREREQAEVLRAAENARQANEEAAHQKNTLSTMVNYVSVVLNQNNLDWGDLLVYAFDPKLNPGYFRTQQFWHHPKSFSKLMRLWLCHGATRSGQQLVKNFAIDLVSRLMRHEAQQATREGFLRLEPGRLPIQEIEEFAPQELTGQLNSNCGTTISILKVICTSSAQERALTTVGKRRKEKVGIHFNFDYVTDKYL
ncbi:hypothetical protein FRC11_001881 [Ceratobasidium sp. 423]|nr:hypothetical protein FRC11_001881 [Ceratobasidium sp. 423]